MSATAPGGVRAGEVTAFGVLTVLGLAAFVTSFGYGILLDDNRVGPGLLPMVTGLLLAVLGGVQLLARLRSPRSPAPADAPGAEPDVFGRTERQRVRQLRLVMVALPVAVLLVPLLGLLAAFGLLVLFVSTVVERRRPLPALLVTAVTVAVGYLVFDLFLGVPLPTGLLGELTGG